MKRRGKVDLKTKKVLELREVFQKQWRSVV
jgi:hypothetical protein